MEYRSRPQTVDAVQWTGDNFPDMQAFANEGDFVRVKVDDSTMELPPLPIEPLPTQDDVWHVGDLSLSLLAGVHGAQGWVPVPVGHWLVCSSGDRSHVWPVDPSYFDSKYVPHVKVVMGEGYEDTVTGYRGKATTHSTSFDGKIRVCLERPNSDGKPEEAWVDLARLRRCAVDFGPSKVGFKA